jgi:ABC-type lipoprotein export system ATPase subunit
MRPSLRVVLLLLLLQLMALCCVLTEATRTAPHGNALSVVEDDADEGAESDASMFLREHLMMTSSYAPHSSSTNTTREGLVWHNLQIWAARHHHHQDRQQLVQSTSGLLPNGRLAGLLGPSGSGKTTFLSSIAGLSSHLHVSGAVGHYTTRNPASRRGNKNHSAANSNTTADVIHIYPIPIQQVAWLQQTDDFFSMLTVQETLQLAAYLELLEHSAAERDAAVQRTAAQLGLSHALHRTVGDPGSGAVQASSSSMAVPFLPKAVSTLSSSLPGRRTDNSNYSYDYGSGQLSGGERRRLSVALELLTDKQLLIADEPTSGKACNVSFVSSFLHPKS